MAETPLRLVSESGESVGQGTLPSPCPASRLNPLEPGSGFDKPPPVYFGQPGVSGLTPSYDPHHYNRYRPFNDMGSSPLRGWTLEGLQIATGGNGAEQGSSGGHQRHGQGQWIVSHPMSLTSAYWRVCRREPMYTTVHAQTVATVDFMFCSSRAVNGACLKPIGVLNVPSVKPTSMPSRDWASDHLFLAAEFWMGADTGPDQNSEGDDIRAGGNGGNMAAEGRQRESQWGTRHWDPVGQQSAMLRWQ